MSVKEAELSFILLMALSSNLDNIGIGIAYGSRGISIPFASNLLIAVITSLGTFLSAALGKSMYLFFRPETANYIGSAILIVAGLWVAVYDSIAPAREVSLSNADEAAITSPPPSFFRKLLSILDNPSMADVDFSRHIDLKEGAILGLALTLNNLAGGIGAGMVGLNIVRLTVFVFIFSIATILAGLLCGSSFGARVFGKYSGFAAGLILICIGVCELL